MRGTDVAALLGYALATPFVVYLPLFKRMWRGDLRLLAVQELGVALIVTGWAARGEVPAVVVNGGYGIGLAVAYAVSRRGRSGRGGATG